MEYVHLGLGLMYGDYAVEIGNFKLQLQLQIAHYRLPIAYGLLPIAYCFVPKKPRAQS